MGYTHFWRCNNWADLDKHPNYQIVLDSMRIIINLTTIPLEVREDIHKYPIHFNGVDENSHETFVFPPYNSFNFCKTRQKPYDIIVTACLTVAKHYFGDIIEVSSDGYPYEWIKGVKLASSILGIEFENPIADES